MPIRLPSRLEKRAAGIAGIDGGIGLDQVGKHAVFIADAAPLLRKPRPWLQCG